MIENVTPWFPPHIKPVHAGWYPRTNEPRNEKGLKWMNWWDGEKWYYNESQKAGDPATKPGHICTYNVCWYWRGLAEKP